LAHPVGVKQECRVDTRARQELSTYRLIESM